MESRYHGGPQRPGHAGGRTDTRWCGTAGRSYGIEEKYGYSAEEIFSSAFFSTRKQQFYDFYRNELLSAVDIPPGKGYLEMARLEQEGIFQTIITRRLFHLPTRAGCRNVIELHGSIFRNYCAHCGREYPVEYIRNTEKIPCARRAGSRCGRALSSSGRWWTTR